MKLMRLSPLSQRLRRIARAHAAGESTRDEYRQARRLLLVELQRAPARKLDDTHRRAEVASLVRQPSAGIGSTVAMRASASSRPGRLRPQLRWLVGALGVVLAALWGFMHA